MTIKTALILNVVGKYDKTIRKQVQLSTKTEVIFCSKAARLGQQLYWRFLWFPELILWNSLSWTRTLVWSLPRYSQQKETQNGDLLYYGDYFMISCSSTLPITISSSKHQSSHMLTQNVPFLKHVLSSRLTVGTEVQLKKLVQHLCLDMPS